MLNVQCRLCSSTTALITLFGGKAKTNRDYIRKLVEITTGIKFQKNDVCKCICLACSVQIYNFYLFRIQSVENDRALQALTQEEKEKMRSRKGDVDLEAIILPSIEDLKENLSTWFFSKQQYCEENNEGGINNIQGFNNDREKHKNKDLIDGSTQTDLIEHTPIGTQYELHCSETGTQTCKVLVETKNIQCGLLAESSEISTQTAENNLTEKTDKSTQYNSPTIEPDILEEGYREKACLGNKPGGANKKIQCDLCSCGRQIKLRAPTRMRKKNQEFISTKNNSIGSKGQTDHSLGIICSCNVLKSEIDTQTDALQTECVEIQCELIKSNPTVTDIVDPSSPINPQEFFFMENQSELVAKGKNVDYERSPISRYTTRSSLTSISEERRKTPKNSPKINRIAIPECREISSQTKISFAGNISTEIFSVIGLVDEFSTKNVEDCSTQTNNREVPNFKQTDTEDSKNVGKSLSAVYETIPKANLIPKTDVIANPTDLNLSKPLNLDIRNEIMPFNRLIVPAESKNEPLLSPGLYVSPRSSNLLTIKDKTQHVIICPQCDTTVYSNSEFKMHKRSHMQCHFCKKRFRSLKRAKCHVEYQCEVHKLMKAEPIVTLIRLENLTDIQKKYPECIELLRNYHETFKEEDTNRVIRIRSKSVSDTDSVINCTACKACVSVINKVSIGVDKSIQVNFIFDSDLVTPLKFLYKKDICGKEDMDDCLSVDGGPLKKIKLSPNLPTLLDAV